MLSDHSEHDALSVFLQLNLLLSGCNSVVPVDDVIEWTACLAWVSVFHLTPVTALHTGPNSRWAWLSEAAARQLLCCGWRRPNYRKIQDSATWNTFTHTPTHTKSIRTQALAWLVVRVFVNFLQCWVFLNESDFLKCSIRALFPNTRCHFLCERGALSAALCWLSCGGGWYMLSLQFLQVPCVFWHEKWFVAKGHTQQVGYKARLICSRSRLAHHTWWTLARQ